MAGAGGIRAGRAFVELYADAQLLTRDLAKAGRQLQSWGRGVNAAGKSMFALGTVGMGLGLAISGGMDLAAKSFGDAGAELVRMSQRTGMTVETLGALKYAADQSGVEMEMFETAIRRMQKTLQVGDKTFARMGLNFRALRAMSPEDALAIIAMRMDKVTKADEKATYALNIFGRYAGTKMIPILKELAELIKEAGPAGIVMSESSAMAALELNKALHLVGMQLKSVWYTIGEAVAPTLKEYAALVGRLTVDSKKWIIANKGLVTSLIQISAVVIVGSAALIGLGFILMSIGRTLIFVGGALRVFGAIAGFLLSVPGAIVSVAAAIFLLNGGAKMIKQTWANASSTMITAWQAVVQAIQAGELIAAMKVAVAGMKLVWTQAMDDLAKGWQETMQRLGIADQIKKTAIDAAQAADAFNYAATAGTRARVASPSWLKSVLNAVVPKTTRQMMGLESAAPPLAPGQVLPGRHDLENQLRKMYAEEEARAKTGVPDTRVAEAIKELEKAIKEAKEAPWLRAMAGTIAPNLGGKSILGAAADLDIPMGKSRGTFSAFEALQMPGKPEGKEQLEVLKTIADLNSKQLDVMMHTSGFVFQ